MYILAVPVSTSMIYSDDDAATVCIIFTVKYAHLVTYRIVSREFRSARMTDLSVNRMFIREEDEGVENGGIEVRSSSC